MPEYIEATIDRIKAEIARLANDIRERDDFGRDSILNVHGLVCLMRYAVWRDEPAFKEWIMGKRFSINEGILQRIFLHKDLEDQDGVELRIHIFSDGNETFKHNHQQDFITMCIHGEYEYTYFTIIEDDSATHELLERLPGVATIKDLELNKPGLIIEAEVDEHGELVPRPGKKSMFCEGDEPVFVDRRWHHTVNHLNKEIPVITIVARRGKRQGKTTVIQDLTKDRDAREDQKPIKINPAQPEREEMYLRVRQALMRRGFSTETNEIKIQGERTDLERYMTNINQLVWFNPEVLDNENILNSIEHFMKSNQFTSSPIIDENGKCMTILRRPVSSEANEKGLQRRSPQPLKKSEHILGAVLWNIFSRDLVVPIIDKNDKVCGLFSISDLVESDEEFDRALIYSIAKQKREDGGERITRNFLERLKYLHDLAFNEDKKASKSDLDSSINHLMLALGPLIVLSPDLDSGRFKEVMPKEAGSRSWLHRSAIWPMYKYDVSSFDNIGQINDANRLLIALKDSCDIDQILLESSTGDIRILRTETGIESPEIFDGNSSIEDVLSRLKTDTSPLLLKNSEGTYGIFTAEEFSNNPALIELAKFSASNNNSDLNEILNRHIVLVTACKNSNLSFEQIQSLL